MVFLIHPAIIVGQSNERVELDQNHFVFQSFSPKRPTAFKIWQMKLFADYEFIDIYIQLCKM